MKPYSTEFWRNLGDLHASGRLDDAADALAQPSSMGPAIDRREFLSAMAASLALAGLAGCTPEPAATIVPYVRTPEDLIPGRPQFYATAVPVAGVATGVLVESHLGRPTKIEGNPDHPASFGATDVLTQASILELYDPDRSQTVIRRGRISTWDAFVTALTREMDARRLAGGRGLRLLTGAVTSPTLNRQIETLLRSMPEARWHVYEPAESDAARLGAQLAFGRLADAIYRFESADIIVSLDADFLSSIPANLRYQREFSARRRPDIANSPMNRLYVVESAPSITGSMADHRFVMRSGEIGAIVRMIANAVTATSAGGAQLSAQPAPPWLPPLLEDLSSHRGRSVVIAGRSQPPEVHALVHRINEALGNIGNTVDFIEPLEASPQSHDESLRLLVSEMSRSEVSALIFLGSNPVYDAPGDLNFRANMARVPLSISCALYNDETAELCEWHIPQAHVLESWSDARAYDGTVTIIQPLINPLYGGKTFHEMLAALTGAPGRSSREIVQEYWSTEHAGGDFAAFWHQSLNTGFVAGTSRPPLQEIRTIPAGSADAATVVPPEANQIEVVFQPDPSIYDGRFANNGWLQELPRPFTHITWDGPALLGVNTARGLNIENGDVIEVRCGNLAMEFPAWTVPGHSENSLTLPLGYGRWRSGRLGNVGSNAYALRSSNSPWIQAGEIRVTGKRNVLATTQKHHEMENRNLVRVAALEEYRQNPDFAHAGEQLPDAEHSLLPSWAQEGVQWGMSIDLNSCIGCRACVIACQAENNIPVVGKSEVLRGREMHWIRIDRYYSGPAENPDFYHQPVPCMHCETAPCELVCPVAATTHSSEGLNEMTYNRCVGTRYCSNNCPYKVRRFNFFQYADYETPTMKLLYNPDVTVRSRGVMEKCTYCVQRINKARIDAEKEQRPIRDGEVQTACQAVCPSAAIVFGDIHNPDSQVARRKASPLNYGLLADLNTRPRTTYGARLRNPNPRLGAQAQ